MLIMCSQEAITATINLNDDDQSTIRRMLTYLYTLDYDDQDASNATAMEESQNTGGHDTDSSSKPEKVDDATAIHRKRMNNVLVYALAEKYNISALKELAATKFVGCEGPVAFAQHQDLVNAIFESTPDTDMRLRNVVILDCVNPQFIEKVLEEEGLAPAIRGHGILGLGMLREVVKKHKAELENLNAELETKEQDAYAREKDLRIALHGSNAELKNLRAQLERQKRRANDRVLEIQHDLDDLYHDAMNFYIPKKKDSPEALGRFRQALSAFQQKLLNLCNDVQQGLQAGQSE